LIRVLVVDDSETFRAYAVQTLESDPDIAVVGCASTGHQAIEMVARLKPTLITMDALMPDLDGVEATRLILESYRIPIIIVSAVASGHHGIRALGVGAVEALAKPISGADRQRFRAQLLQSVKLLSEVPILLRRQSPHPVPSHTWSPSSARSRDAKVIAIGASTGGPGIINSIFQSLPREFRPAIVIAQHISEGFDRFLVDWWCQATSHPVELAASGKSLAPGTIWVAPANQHLVVNRNETIECIRPSAGDLYLPSIDRLFASVASCFGRSAVGLLLSGMGDDGAAGLLAMRAAGANTAVQDPRSAVIDSMPARALAVGAARTVLKPEEIAAWVGGITTPA
jgi:two-component system chemotaxis response regulator CheB